MPAPAHYSVHGKADSTTASLVIFPDYIAVIDTETRFHIPRSAVDRSAVLTHALRDASVECSGHVRTNFSVDQIHLWAAHTRSPLLFRIQSTLYNTLAALEVADMLADDKSVSKLSGHLAIDYLPLLPLRAAAPEDTDGGHAGSAQRPTQPGGRNQKLPRRCKAPQPRMRCTDAFLWGTPGSVVEALRAVTPAALQHCCEAAKDLHEARSAGLGSAAASGRHPAELLCKALRILPEHLLVRVLRAWDPAMSIQTSLNWLDQGICLSADTLPLQMRLATLPKRFHPSALSAVFPCIDKQHSLDIPELSAPLFRRAVRATAKLAALRRVNAVTLHPPSPCDTTASTTATPTSPASALWFATRQLGRLPGITFLHLAGTAREWLGTNDLRGLSCIAAMPHVRAVRAEQVKLEKLPGLLEALAPMTQLQRLDLELRFVPMVRKGGCGAAEAARQVCTALPNLTSLQLRVLYNRLNRIDPQMLSYLTTRLHELRQSRVSVTNELSWEGRRPMTSVLGMLCSPPAALSTTDSWVEESGCVYIEAMRDVAGGLHGLWNAVVEVSAEEREVERLELGLNCRGVRMSRDAELLVIAPSLLRAVPRLGALHLVCGGVMNCSCAATLARIMYALTPLTMLNMSDCSLGPREAAILLPRLSCLTALQHLNLRNNCMGPEGGAALAPGLSTMCMLIHLQLRGNDLGERGVAAVLDALAPQAVTGLKCLDIGMNCLGVEGSVTLARRLPAMRALEALDLSANIIGAAGAAVLSPAIKPLRLLIDLSLARNFLECHGALALARCLPQLTRLTGLDLSCNAIGAVGMRAVARTLPALACLETFSASHNCFADPGAKGIARAVLAFSPDARSYRDYAGVSQPRRVLILDGCEIGDAGLLALAHAADCCRHGDFKMVVDKNMVSKRVWYSLVSGRERGASWGPCSTLCNDDGSWDIYFMDV
eukprot:jgi/Ulvmu1/3442/UM016_0061.1